MRPQSAPSPAAAAPRVAAKRPGLNWSEGARRLGYVLTALYGLAALLFAGSAFYSHRLDLRPSFTLRSPEGFTYVVHAPTKADALAAVRVYAKRVEQEYAAYAAADMEPIEVPAVTKPRFSVMNGLEAAGPVLARWAIGFVAIWSLLKAGMWVGRGFAARSKVPQGPEVAPIGIDTAMAARTAVRPR
jgi:hypothetical protein